MITFHGLCNKHSGIHPTIELYLEHTGSIQQTTTYLLRGLPRTLRRTESRCRSMGGLQSISSCQARYQSKHKRPILLASPCGLCVPHVFRRPSPVCVVYISKDKFPTSNVKSCFEVYKLKNHPAFSSALNDEVTRTTPLSR